MKVTNEAIEVWKEKGREAARRGNYASAKALTNMLPQRYRKAFEQGYREEKEGK